MSYALTLHAGDDASAADCRAAEQRFRHTLEATLGDAGLVAPVYGAYLRIIAAHGDTPSPEALTDAEREVFVQWQAAESAAVAAAFGPHRYLDEPQFEIHVTS
jgi:hypothetical protein